MSVLLGSPPVGLAESERRALAVLSESGLLPPLRLSRADGDGEDAAQAV